ncbi:heme peroxidase [Mollisia scopiformis]|uniref:Heme peroxidase n=1 Tax=Mollisia scopiformis TaxID=149040 RepID=A0A194X0T0_MOLSC|nr:heme peroxidase [Mollisia scopiformis]KUJ13569.1 heme peroxidase [Mollisia scopiformis]
MEHMTSLFASKGKITVADSTPAPPPIDPKDGPDHSISPSEEILATLDSLSQLIQLSNRPLKTGTGDGSYAVTSKTGGSAADLRALGLTDYDSVHSLLEQELGTSELTDDKSLLLERVIQLLAKLPADSDNRISLTNALIRNLWDSRSHLAPSLSYFGDYYNHRQPNGSHNNTEFPDIGKAGMEYCRSVQPKIAQPNPKPEPGLVFDTLMSRKDACSITWRQSSLTPYHDDMTYNTTSSYLDLSPLYGNTSSDQIHMRTYKDGQLKPDSFWAKRLLGFPPGVGCILIMFNRFHNYVVQNLAAINENGRFNKPASDLSDDEAEPLWANRDEELFQVGRLVTCGMYINLILIDYFRTVLGLNKVESTWNLNSRAGLNSKVTPSGTGNQCSLEFNLVHRWHSYVSQRDEKWSRDLFKKLFGKDHQEITARELLAGLKKLEAETPDDPLLRDFEDLKRGTDGKYNDDDLVDILMASVEEVAGSSGANNVPEVLRAVEILGMEQARTWKCATLNEFRSFSGLKPYTSFEAFNSDPAVSSKMRQLYDHPDFVELYPSLVCEETTKPMSPGVGVSLSYTTSRAMLSDAVSLVRGDRFYNNDYHPGNLTNWGYHEVAYDTSVNQGCMFYKLIIRANYMLCGASPFFSARREQIKQCLYAEQWADKIKAFYEDITLKLLEKWSYGLGGNTNQVDIVRDVGNSAHTYFAANIFSLPLKSEAHPKGLFNEHELYMILVVMFTLIFFGDRDPATTFALRSAALPLCLALGALVEQNVSIISKTGLLSGFLDPFFEEHNALKDYGVHMIRNILSTGLGVHATAWGQILVTSFAVVSNQGQVFAQIIDFYLHQGKEHLPEINRIAKLNTEEADKVLLHYVMEALRIAGTIAVSHRCNKDIIIKDGDKDVSFKTGDNVFVSYIELNHNPDTYPDPDVVKLDRPIDSYTVYSIGTHACLCGGASKVSLIAMLKVVGRLDNLRAAPGEQGEIKKLPLPGGFCLNMDTTQSSYFPFPTSMKVRWDGGFNAPV